MTRGEEEGDNRGKQGKGQVKDHVYKGPMDQDNGEGGLNVGGVVDRAGESNRGKWGQL